MAKLVFFIFNFYNIDARSKRCKREISKQKSMDKQYPFVGAAVGIVLSTLAVVADFIAHGTTSLIANPIFKGNNKELRTLELILPIM